MAKAEESAASSIIDYVSVIISPVLIMGMLISLVFFLIDVLYGGNYSERLSYTMFFYVFAAVLIARISIQYGTARAMAYVFGLGIVTFIVMLYYVTYPTPLMQSIGPLINIGLMVMVSWCASKLTWDCTHLDGERDAGGQSQ